MSGLPRPETAGEKVAAGLLAGILAALAALGMWRVVLAMAVLAGGAAAVLVLARVLMDAAAAAGLEGGSDGDA